MRQQTKSKPMQAEAKTKSLVEKNTDVIYCNLDGNGGCEYELQKANIQLVVGKSYIVTNVEMYPSVTYITLEGEDGYFNSAIFDVDHEALIRWYFHRTVKRQMILKGADASPPHHGGKMKGRREQNQLHSA